MTTNTFTKTIDYNKKLLLISKLCLIILYYINENKNGTTIEDIKEKILQHYPNSVSINLLKAKEKDLLRWNLIYEYEVNGKVKIFSNKNIDEEKLKEHVRRFISI